MTASHLIIAKERDYRAIFFDMGYTLEHTEPDLVEIDELILRGMGVDAGEEAVRDGLRRAWAKMGWRFVAAGGTLAPEDPFWMDFNRTLLENIVRGEDLDELAEEFGRRSRESILPIRRFCPPEVHLVLDQLKRRGYTMGVVSNWDDTLPEICAKYGLTKYFDFILASQVVGSEKPDPGIFCLALQKAGVPPERAVHVGDFYYADVVGARRAGITPVLLDRQGIFPDADCTRIEDIREILDLLR
ncbi:MAG: HAD family hydrolase [bacterium]